MLNVLEQNYPFLGKDFQEYSTSKHKHFKMHEKVKIQLHKTI
jgi:hypothetical protein